MRYMGFDPQLFVAGALQLAYIIILLLLFGLSIYCLILFVKLAHRGIKALDIYLEKNKD